MRFGLSFVSLINPFLLINMSYSNYLRASNVRSKTNTKIYVKQSYMVLTWFYYLSFLEKKTSTDRVKLFVAKKNLKKFTVTKAPIAHKNWSKEQYLFSFFKFTIFFNFKFKDKNLYSSFFIKDVNSALYFMIISKNEFLPPETNLLVCKRTGIQLSFKDSSFFSYKF